MSLPRDILDQLLSGYVDDALSNDERARVEQLMRDDDEVARELRELRDLRETLREIHREDQQLTLGANFADRVLKATVDQATAEGLSDQHPVMRLTEQPSTVVTRGGLPLAKIAGAVAALAASVIIAVALLRPPVEDPQQDLIAQNDPPTVLDASDNVPEQPVIEQETPITLGPVDQLAQDNTTNNLSSPGELPDELEMPIKDDNKISTSSNADRIVQVNSRPPSVTPTPSILPKDLDPRLLAHGFVMVVDVRQTEEGRGSNAVGKAMLKASIKPFDQKQINEDIVGFSNTLVGEDQSVSVLYLEDLGKKLDNFINEMVADLSGIESVGFAFVADAPIIDVANALRRIDPTTVHHSWQLTDDGSHSLQLLAQELGSRKFSAVKRDGAAPALTGNGVEGPDFKTRIFVLVR